MSSHDNPVLQELRECAPGGYWDIQSALLCLTDMCADSTVWQCAEGQADEAEVILTRLHNLHCGEEHD